MLKSRISTDTLYKPIPVRRWPLLNVSITRRIQSFAVTCSFPYSTFPLYCLLHNVSYTRHIQWQALLAFLLKHSTTRHFNYSTFRRFQKQHATGTNLHTHRLRPPCVSCHKNDMYLYHMYLSYGTVRSVYLNILPQRTPNIIIIVVIIYSTTVWRITGKITNTAIFDTYAQ